MYTITIPANWWSQVEQYLTANFLTTPADYIYMPEGQFIRITFNNYNNYRMVVFRWGAIIVTFHPPLTLPGRRRFLKRYPFFG